MITQAVVQFSGGVGSWAAAKRTVEKYGAENTELLFADTRMEDEDLYRFVTQAAADVGAPLTVIADGRTPWQVFNDVRFLGNTRIDPCSRILKRDLLRRWMDSMRDPADCAVVIGIDWTEEHRFTRAAPRWLPWRLEAPLCEPPLVDKDVLLLRLRRAGIKPPRLYEMGFPHNNCGGFCVKAGQAQFKLLYEKMPDRYLQHEAEEESLSAHLGKKVTVLRDRRGGTTRPLSMREFRSRLEGNENVDETEWGGCGCAID